MSRDQEDMTKKESKSPRAGSLIKRLIQANLVAFALIVLLAYTVWPLLIQMQAPARCERHLEYQFARALKYESAELNEAIERSIQLKNRMYEDCSIVKYAVLDERPTEVEVSLYHRVKVLAWNFHIWRTLNVPLSVDE